MTGQLKAQREGGGQQEEDVMIDVGVFNLELLRSSPAAQLTSVR